MTEPEQAPTTTTPVRANSRLPTLLLRRAGAIGYAKQVNEFAIAQNPGSYSLVISHRFAEPCITRTLRVRHGDEQLGFTLLREPVSCHWLVLPFDDPTPASLDVWDVLFASDRHAYDAEQQAVEAVLISLGYLHPGIGSPQAAYRVAALRGLAADKWTQLWLDERDLDTRVCGGCEECGWGNERRFHRVELAGEAG